MFKKLEDLGQLLEGRASDLFRKLFRAMVDDVKELTKDPTAPRVITLKITMRATEDREHAMYSIDGSMKPASHKKLQGQLTLDTMDDGTINVYESRLDGVMPGQQTIDGGEVPEGASFRLVPGGAKIDQETGEVK